MHKVRKCLPDNIFALACEVLNPVPRFEIHLLVHLGSKKGQVVIVSLEGAIAVSLQEGLVCEVFLVDRDVMPEDDLDDLRSDRSLHWVLGDPLRWRERGIVVINYLLVAAASFEGAGEVLKLGGQEESRRRFHQRPCSKPD